MGELFDKSIKLLDEPMDSYIRKNSPKITFRELLEKYRVEKDAGSYGSLCTIAGINRDTLNKIIKWNDGTDNRDIIWGLSIVMGLNMDEIEALFKTCGMTTDTCRVEMLSRSHTRTNTPAREAGIKYGILQGWNIDKINDELERRGFETLGFV